MNQTPEFSALLSETKRKIKDPFLPLQHKTLLVSEMLNYLNSNFILSPISCLTENDLLGELFKLKGSYYRDWELIDLVYLLVSTGSRSGLKHLIENMVLKVVFSFIPHRKVKILEKISFILGKLAGVSTKAKEEIIRSGNLGLLIELLKGESTEKTFLSLSYMVYKCSFDLNKCDLEIFVPGLEFAIRLMGAKEIKGVILANCYETIHNIVSCHLHVDVIASFSNLIPKFLASFDKWSPSLHSSSVVPLLDEEENLLASFSRLSLDLTRSFPMGFLPLALSKGIVAKLALFLVGDGGAVQGTLLGFFDEILDRTEISDECLMLTIQTRGMIQWMEKGLQTDRKEKFNLALKMMEQGMKGSNLRKFIASLASESMIFQILIDDYATLVSRERRMVILEIFFLLARFSETQNREASFQIDSTDLRAFIREIMLEFYKIERNSCSDHEERTKVDEIKGIIREYLKKTGFMT